MKAQYIRLMDKVHQACLFVAGACLVIITLIIPYGVFCRYVLNSAASWPEPLAVLLMIVLSFLSAVVCYREYLHIGVGVLPAFLNEPAKSYLGWFLEICMLATNLFMFGGASSWSRRRGTSPFRNSRSCGWASPTCRSRSAARSQPCS